MTLLIKGGIPQVAKKHRDRPALRAVQVWRWIVNGILEIQPVPRTPIFYLVNGKSVRQRWLRRIKNKISWMSAKTYLRKGTFLVPRWISISNKWRVEFLQEYDLMTRAMGIAIFDGAPMELCYMQVDDLDHCLRQQTYILDGYSEFEKRPNMAQFLDLFDLLARVESITSKIIVRKMGADSLQSWLLGRLNSFARSVGSIRTHAPLFKGRQVTEAEQNAILRTLERVARDCRLLTMRPVGARLARAARSLDLACRHILNGRIDLACDRLDSALRNFNYPTIQ